MQYGGEDREMGERMMNVGIQPIQARYSLVTMHLDHPRGYVNNEMLEKNNAIRKISRSKKKKWTDFGIVKNI